MKAAAVTKPEPVDLIQTAQLCALGGIVKDAQLTAAKRALPDSFAQPVDFTVHVRGLVTKGVSTPGSSGIRPATCELANASTISQVLLELEVTPAKLKQIIRRIVKKHGHATDLSGNPANAEMLNAFTEVAKEVAETLEPKPWSTKGTAGAVNTNVTYEILAAA